MQIKNKENKNRQKKKRACQKFSVEEERPYLLDGGSHQLSKAHEKDITLKRVWERA